MIDPASAGFFLLVYRKEPEKEAGYINKSKLRAMIAIPAINP